MADETCFNDSFDEAIMDYLATDPDLSAMIDNSTNIDELACEKMEEIPKIMSNSDSDSDLDKPLHLLKKQTRCSLSVEEPQDEGDDYQDISSFDDSDNDETFNPSQSDISGDTTESEITLPEIAQK